MPTIHFLNVKNGDCSIIEHVSGHTTVIDVCNAASVGALSALYQSYMKSAADAERGVTGNFNQKKYPVNPISYMEDHGLNSVFRFILTHPDMDHMDGIEAFFDAFSPLNFWDTDNREEKDFSGGINGYDEKDWKFYKNLRDSKPENNPKRLTLLADSVGQYYNQGEGGTAGGDGLYLLAPTKKLLDDANECGDYNDCSYVILYRTGNHKILFAGDSHDATWEHILENHEADVKDVDLLIAPHHGRHSDRDWEFLEVVNPALTFFGNANSEHLAYSAWNSRGLRFITNNQGGCMVVNAGVEPMDVYVTCKAYAESLNPGNAVYDAKLQAYYWGEAVRTRAAAY
jgi:competence protein ComEC